MLKIDCDNKITITRGDTGFVNFRTANRKLINGDTVIMAIQDIGEIQNNKFNSAGATTLKIDVAESSHDIRAYNYTIRVHTHDGIEETVIQGIFEIVK